VHLKIGKFFAIVMDADSLVSTHTYNKCTRSFVFFSLPPSLPPSSTFPTSESSQPSLLDLDALFSSGTGGSQMPTPLKPTSSSASSSKTPHIPAPLLPSPPLGIRGGGASSANTSGSGPLIATTSFHTKPLDPSGGRGPRMMHMCMKVLCHTCGWLREFSSLFPGLLKVWLRI